MAKILADFEIKKLLGSVLIGCDESCINPNGVELRLGKEVRFHSTGEEQELSPGTYLKVNPGETVVISSLEKIDFTAETVQLIYPQSMLMGLITPTTTMMREGIIQVATKVDAGFRGVLNWGLRNGSSKELIIEFGEAIFKLTIFKLEENEVPEIPYGGRKEDEYQDAAGVVRSKRRIPADIPDNKIMASSFDKLDPKKQLREAGYPFDHIGTELVSLHGKFELVSKDVSLLKDQFEKQTNQLSAKIESETQSISSRLEELRNSVIEKVEAIFDQKFLKIVGVVIGAISVMYAGLTFLQAKKLSTNLLIFIAAVVGIAIMFIAYLLSRRSK